MKTKKRKKLCLICGISSCLCLMAPLILISCSSTQQTESNPTINSISTEFVQSGSVQNDAKLNNIFASNAKNQLNDLSTYIFTNLIKGKKDQLTISTISIDKSSLLDDDYGGTLSLSYSINTYWENDQFIETTPKIVATNINGFLLKTNQTQFIDSKNASVLNTNLAIYDVYELTTKINELKQWIFDNQIDGNKTSLNKDNVSIVLLDNLDIANGTVNLSYNLNKYWSNKGIVTNPSANYSINLTDFTKRNLTDAETIKLISDGGSFDGLEYSGFLNVFKVLQINSKTRINSLTNSYLNDKIHAIDDFKNITLTILSGNQTNKTLSVSITGQYKNVNIPTANNIVNIVGFKNLYSDYQLRTNLSVSTMHINFDQYFANLQDPTSMINWTNDDWFNQYLAKMEFVLYPPSDQYLINIDALDFYKQKVLSNVNLININNVINNNNSYKDFALSFSYQNYSYDSLSQTWLAINDVNKQDFYYKFVSAKSFVAPKRIDAINYIAKNKITIEQNEVSKFYASLIYSRINYSHDIGSIGSLFTINQQYLNKYFKNDNVIIEAEDGQIIVDDLLGTAKISYKLVIPDNGEDLFNHNTVAISGFKKLSTFINNNSAPEMNAAIIQRDTSIFKRIIKDIKSEFTKDDLMAWAINQSSKMKSAPAAFLINVGNGYIYNGTSTFESGNRHWVTQILKTATFTLFGSTLSESFINLESNLVRRGNERFVIEYIRYDIDIANTKPTLTKQNNTTYVYKVPFSYQVDILANDSPIIVNGFYVANILESDL